MLCLSHLSYTYPGETEPALKDFTLEIHAGEHIALVGASGAGKSTLAALLLRFIEPDEGSLAVDDQPATAIPLDAWRRLVTWVPQNPSLFHDTIAVNLRLAKPEASTNELEAAMRLANLDQFVQSLPDGYETMIGEAGARLSAGQAQRLALARAFLKDAPILILDEPTSSLDPEQEQLVEASLRELLQKKLSEDYAQSGVPLRGTFHAAEDGGESNFRIDTKRVTGSGQPRTVITIAHRLNTVFQADKIVVLEGGRIVETGTHSELLAHGGAYARLVHAPAGMESQPSGVESQISNIQGDLRPSTFDPQPPTSLQSQIFNHKSSIKNPQSSILFRLLGFLRGSWGWVVLSVLLGALTVGSNVGLMGTSAFLIASAALHPELGTLEVAIVGVRFFGIARGVFRYAERLTSHNVTFRLLARLRTWFYRALEPLAPARLMQYRSGDLLGRIVSDVETLENFYVRAVSPPLVAVLVAAGMTVFFGRYSGELAWTYLAWMLLLGLGVPVLAASLSRRAGAQLIAQRARLQARLVEGIQGLADILAFGRGAEASAHILEDGRAYGNTQRRLAALSGLSGGLTVLLVNVGMLAVLALAIPLVGAGRMPGELLAVLALAALAGFEAVMPLPQAAQTLSASCRAASRLFEIVDAQPAVSNQRLAVSGHQSISSLEFSQVSFAYPGSRDFALQKISFRLARGKRVAIVGPSGAGKSTLANLLLRFWDYSQGEIRWDGRELHEYPQEEVRRLFSFVSQRSYFFNDSIRQNLLLARPEASQAEIQKAAERAQIQAFIAGLPQGYDTIIGERGYRLSGGERQRLAIARAVLKDAPIFLLDEPTANLDTLNERLILDTLFQVTGSRALLLITHRLVGLENMDEILVLEHGRIVERGTQDELLASDGLYRRLWDLQNRMLADR